MPSPKFTLVPAPLYDPGKKDEYFTFNHILEEDNIILPIRLSDPDAFIVFSVSKSYSDLMNSSYPGVHPYHHIKPLAESYFSQQEKCKWQLYSCSC